MSNNSGSSTPTQIGVTESYGRCVGSLRDLILILNHQLVHDLEHGEKELAKALEIYGRLRTWGEESRAALPAASRGSLDDTLRKDRELKSTINSVLDKIQRQIRFAIDDIEKPQDEVDTLDNIEEQDSDTDSYMESSSEDGEGDEQQLDSGSFSAHSKVFRYIDEDIDSLSQILVLIRRPGFNRRYLHSTGKMDFDPGIAHYAEYDKLHVEEKFRDWRNQRNKVDSNEPIATAEMLEQRTALHETVEKPKFLIWRLATANTQRREQLLYWSKYPDQAPTTADSYLERPVPAVGSSLAGKYQERTIMQKPMQPSSVITDAQDTQSQGLKSNMFSTVAASDVFRAQIVDGPARTTYAESTVGKKISNRVPEAPKAAFREESFQCPYCRLMLDSKEMQTRLEWKRHVFRDLRPYICTFEQCQNPNKQYLTRRDWIYHEMLMHRRQWKCVEHDAAFPSKVAFVEHVNELHSSSVATRQISVLVDMSERATDEMTIVPCPLCPDQRQLVKLHSHIAEHLEAVSLFVLPTDVELEDGHDEGKSSSRRVADGDRSSRVDISTGSSVSYTSQRTSDVISNVRLDVKTIKEGLKAPKDYRDVAVLIIRWDESMDELKTRELERLQSIFRQRFGFKSGVHSIKLSQRPQFDLNKAILDHLYEYDHPDNLLIFCYLGLSRTVDDRLVLLPDTTSVNDRGRYDLIAFWDKAEEVIYSSMEGDAIGILDCSMVSCAASREKYLPRTLDSPSASGAYVQGSAKGPGSITNALSDTIEELVEEQGGREDTTLITLSHRFNRELLALKKEKRVHRVYQMLVRAGVDEPRHTPGQMSFAGSLCDSLEILLDEAGGKDFSLSMLRDQINKTRGTQPCMILDRLPLSNQRAIQLGPLANGQWVRFDEPFEERHKTVNYFGFYEAARTVLFIQRFRSAVRRKNNTPHEEEETLDQFQFGQFQFDQLHTRWHEWYRKAIFQSEGLPLRAPLLLRFSLESNGLTPNIVEKLAEHLPRACTKAQIPVRRIEWNVISVPSQLLTTVTIRVELTEPKLLERHLEELMEPKSSETHLEELTRVLPNALQRAEIGLTRIDWRGEGIQSDQILPADQWSVLYTKDKS